MKKLDHLTECGCCGLEERSFLYNVRHRGVYRRLCTACVLKNHPGSFCPICFDVFDDDNPPLPRVVCLHCPSISHHSCVATLDHVSSSRYRCPPCSNPNFSFFDISKCDSKKIKSNDGESLAAEGRNRKDVNEDLAKKMVAAAKIAVASMNKAVAVATLEAEKRVKEAAVARKRAKESLEQLACLVSKENMDSKSLTNSKIDSPCLPQNWIQKQVGENNVSAPHNAAPKSILETDGSIHKERGQKSNGLHPVSRH